MTSDDFKPTQRAFQAHKPSKKDRLIADLLGALHMIATYCESNRPVLTKAEMGKIARAAIAKAEGKP